MVDLVIVIVLFPFQCLFVGVPFSVETVVSAFAGSFVVLLGAINGGGRRCRRGPVTWPAFLPCALGAGLRRAVGGRGRDGSLGDVPRRSRHIPRRSRGGRIQNRGGGTEIHGQVDLASVPDLGHSRLLG